MQAPGIIKERKGPVPKGIPAFLVFEAQRIRLGTCYNNDKDNSPE